MLGAATGTIALIIVLASAAIGDTLLHEYFILPPSETNNEEHSEAVEGEGNGEAPDFETEPTEGPPPLTLENRGDEMEFDSSGMPTTPEGEGAPTHNGPIEAEDLAKPDRNTTLDSELTYFTVFNPSVVPWKRTGSRDKVYRDYSMGVSNPKTRRVEVKDRPVTQSRERFWGSVLIKMRPGIRVPLPSVAPNAAILRY
jgi:hypothetical protein